MTPLKIALAKGRLEEETVALPEKTGYDCSQVRSKGRRLTLPVGGGEIEVVLAKAVGVITHVRHGVCDLGIVDKGAIIENTSGFFGVLDLDFDKCRFAVAGPRDSGIFEGYSVKTVVTKYPRVARALFGNRDMDVRIIKIEGPVELAPLLGLAEAIVDLVGTGTTLKENRLEILEIICPISAQLIVNSTVMKLRKDEVEALVFHMSQAIQEKEEKVRLK